MENVNAIIRYNDDTGFYRITNRGSIEKFVLNKADGENVLSFSAISRHLRWLQGEILTVLEATIDDDRKLNATKQLVKDKFSAKISWIYEFCGCPLEEESGLSEDLE